MKIYIYGLYDPRTKLTSDTIRYVGKTKMTLKERLQAHIDNAKKLTGKKSYHSVYWINSLLKNNIKPEIFLIEECNDENWQDREKYWISYYPNLTNYDEGGGSCTFFKKEIHQYDLNGNYLKSFESIQYASECTGIHRQIISNAAIKSPQNIGGFYLWSFNKNYFIKPYVNPKNNIIRIVDMKTGERKLFESLKDGLSYFKIKRVGNVNRCIETGVPLHKRYYIFKIN